MSTIYSLFVTCCGHPDNQYDWIPGCVWTCAWSDEDEYRSGMQMVSSLVPLREGEAPRYVESNLAANPRVVTAEVDGQNQPVREHISEECHECGQPLRMRDDTWNQLSKALERLPNFWRPQASLPEDEGDFVQATIALSVLNGLVRNMRGRTR